jgi:hemolysin activation/secretion protein
VLWAWEEVPLEGQSEVIEKSLRQSLPKELPPKPKAPEITNENKPLIRKPPAGAPIFFIKKIKLTGNTVISDERLMPLVDLGEGKKVSLGMLNAMANEITAVYATEGYLLLPAWGQAHAVKDILRWRTPR